MKLDVPPSSPTLLPDTTRKALLDAAERLFAESGLDRTSVRDITKAARANLGAVNYHFGTKDGLIMAVFSRRLKPLNQRRLELLKSVEDRSVVKLPVLEEVLEAFLRPMVEQQAEDLEMSQSFARLMSRCFQEPNPQVESLIVEHFGELVQRTNTAILKAAPELPGEEVFWRICFLFGSAHHALDVWTRFDVSPFTKMPGSPVPKKLDREALLQRLIAYAAAGIRGTAGSPSGSAR